MIQPARYTAYRASGPLTIDGRLNEPSWQLAPKSGAFVDIVTGDAAWFDTRVAILWDDDYLYFGFWAEETDVWGTLTERDSRIYEENDLEIFIAGKDTYYEFEINALNVVYEVLWFWKDAFRPSPELDPATARTLVLDGVGGHVHERGERWGFLDWDFPGMRSAVHVDGVLNSRANTDIGWTAEIAFPWLGMDWIAEGRPVPPNHGDVWRIDCSRFEKLGPDGAPLDPCVGWTWNRHGHYDSHIPAVVPYITFSTEPVGRL